MTRRAGLLACLLLAPWASDARVLIGQEEALAAAFPTPAAVERRTVFLTEDQLARARDLAGEGTTLESQLVIRYEALRDGATLGYGYVRTMLIRTLPASVLYVVAPGESGEDEVTRVEILSWDEPPDYLPRPGWAEQLERPLGEELSVKRAVRPITGATLTSRALTMGAREVLALHRAIAEGGRE